MTIKAAVKLLILGHAVEQLAVRYYSPDQVWTVVNDPWPGTYYMKQFIEPNWKIV